MIHKTLRTIEEIFKHCLDGYTIYYRGFICKLFDDTGTAPMLAFEITLKELEKGCWTAVKKEDFPWYKQENITFPFLANRLTMENRFLCQELVLVEAIDRNGNLR